MQAGAAGFVLCPGKWQLKLKAFAKVNVTLEVLGRRDDGYHQVTTVMQTIDLADDLVISPCASIQVDCDDPILSGEANLVWDAARILADRHGVETGARVSIYKGIPVGMGLGGGSTDAAAALIGLNRIWGLGLERDELLPVAAELGSDVAFFLAGGTALAEGRGEIISPLPAMPSGPMLVFCPGSTIPRKTAVMYSLLTAEHYSDGAATAELVQLLREGPLEPERVPGLTCNAFEAVAARMFPEFGEIKTLLENMGIGPVRLSGAGPAGFCWPTTVAELKAASDALQTLGVGVYRVNTVSASPAPSISE